LLVLAAFLAGWVDAVVGGGGLIQLPAMLLIPGIAPISALATNKLASSFGTTTSSITYYRRVHPDLHTALPMAAIALAGSMLGALGASILPGDALVPIVLVALVSVTIYTLLRPALGGTTSLRFTGRRHLAAAAGVGLTIGFYDGLIGPGTGSFLVFGLVSILGYAFLEASAKAKIVNLATNIGALIIFIPQGAVIWGLGLLMGAANVGGGYLGARTAVARGSSFVRIVFLIVVTVLMIRLGWQEISRLT
ncbi:MAG: conserved rane protein of unknown function, partial [Jatrophihabitantaceae bacterium]|nr:conserved rane protein of unknown function [Jatrophihabitantaceae bacterium]